MKLKNKLIYVSGEILDKTFSFISKKLPKLKPCPFCGENRLVDGLQLYNLQHTGSYVICLTCLAQGPEDSNKIVAVKKWNSRIKDK